MTLFSVVLPVPMALQLLIISEIQVHAHISTPGDIILGGLFPIHKKGSNENLCGSFNKIPGYQYMEAMLYAIDKMNRSPDILPDIKLGTIIFDTCQSPTISADKTKQFIQLTLSQSLANGSNLAGVIGPFKSGNSIIVADFLRVFGIPQISYGSLSVQLSDKRLYDYFFRTVPPDSFFAEALAVLFKRLGWTYVSIIYSKETYSETGTSEVIKALAKKDICVAKKHRLPRFPDEGDYDQAIKEVVSVKEANVLVFVTIQRDSRGLLMAKKRQPLAKQLSLVGSVSWSNRDDITKGLGDVADGTITFGHMDGNNKEFEDYFRSLNLSNYNANYKGWFEEFWQKQFNCYLGNASETYSKRCSGKESLLTEHMEIAPVRVVINAVNAMAYALHDMHRSLCPNITGLCQKMTSMSRTLLQTFLKNVTFPDSSFKWPITFNQNNEVEGNYTVLNFRKTHDVAYSYVPVGSWMSKLQEDGEILGELEINFSTIHWSNGPKIVPLSRCSPECDERSVKRPRVGHPKKCCWGCVLCKRYDVILNNTCQTCDKGFAPNKNSSTCIKLALKYIDMDTPLAILLTFFSSVGILADLAVFAMFLANRSHVFIKASNQQMCYFIFFGISLVFIIPFTFLVKPTQNICSTEGFLLGISFTVCYAPLLVKVRSFYWLSRKENEASKQWEPNFIGVHSQFLITIGVITMQSILCLVVSTNTHPKLQETFHPEREELLLECSLEPTAFISYLACAVILLFPCTVYAFLSRNILKNFRETIYIGATVYTTNVVWVVFLACFLNMADSFSRIYLISGSSVVIGWITLVGLFAPKVYQMHTRKVFDESSLIIWSGSS